MRDDFVFPQDVIHGPAKDCLGNPPNWIQREGGLTKRELFAAMAFQGLCACPEVSGPRTYLATEAVAFADSLLAELEKDKK